MLCNRLWGSHNAPDPNSRVTLCACAHPQVAIKSIRKDKIKDEQDLVHIRREIEIMSSLNHPHIIAVHEGEPSSPSPFQQHPQTEPLGYRGRLCSSGVSACCSPPSAHSEQKLFAVACAGPVTRRRQGERMLPGCGFPTALPRLRAEQRRGEIPAPEIAASRPVPSPPARRGKPPALKVYVVF